MRHRHQGKVKYHTKRGRVMYRKRPLHKVRIRGNSYNIYRSNRKNKEYMVDVGGKNVHFADPNMDEYPGTKRGDNYCARSSGIKGTGDMHSPNFWSRKLWSCRGKKSIAKRRFV